MTNRHLEIFITVYQQASFSKAADLLYISQPAVSKYINEIEAAYDNQLFARSSHGLMVTPFGEELYDYASRILALYNEMEFSLSNFSRKEKSLRIGAGIAIGNIYLPQLINAFNARHENVHVRVSVGNVPQITQQILDNQLDFALMEWIENPMIRCEHLCTERIVAVCGVHHPLASKKRVTAQDIAAYPLLLLNDKNSYMRKPVDAYFMQNNIQITPLWESNNVTTLLNAAIENIGVTFLSDRQVQALQDARITALPLPDLAAERYIHAYYHKNRPLSPCARDFLNEAAAYINAL